MSITGGKLGRCEPGGEWVGSWFCDLGGYVGWMIGVVI